MAYKLLSLFDGSGGFPLAGSLCGVEPVAASEVEPYPIAVTRSRFPGMKHLGDISKINGAEIEPVHIITFGSPCQDLSVAGKRAGLKHEANGDEETTRSGLFMEAVRIIKEMRGATNGVYPNVVLWENVPGAFSSNRGEDFRVVLEELIKIAEPSATMPPVPTKGGWPYADSYTGDGWSLAYRVFDAQYWGVPQRRRRIHLVLDLRGQRARKILFERDGLRGYFEAGANSWKGTAGDTQSCAAASNQDVTRYGFGNVLPFDTTQVTSPMNYSNPKFGDPCHPLAAGAHPPAVVCLCYDLGEARLRTPSEYLDKCPTITARCGTGGNNVPGVVFCLQGNGIDRSDNAGCNGKGWREGVCYTLNTLDRPAVVYSNLVGYIVRRITPLECNRLQGFADMWGVPDQKDDFTDEEYRFWLDVRNTHAEINGKAVKEYTKEQMLKWYNKLHTDSAEYKMWGNGIALPPALYCMQGIVDALNEVYA